MSNISKQFIKTLVKDVQVDITEAFDRNFERKGFFGTPWADTKHKNPKGSLMMRSGKLRKSMNAKINDTSIQFISSLPYASIHNEGGEIEVTAKMKSFFWAMFYKASGAMTKGTSQRNIRLGEEAMKWKGMALMKLGSKIKIPQRQFIGDHPEVKRIIERRMDLSMKELEQYIKNSLKR